MTRKTAYYIDKPELLAELIQFHRVKAEHPDWTNGECMSPRLTELLMLLVEQIITHRRWNKYTPGYTEEMKGDA